ncbi:hypothetical protein G9P44_005389 [Scheffersomyces stipitis]|nr:hypothetical protein G9P44_005389 [Scheffersomyces stipitis]
MAKNFYNPNTAPYYDPKTDRRVVFITGGNSGIGWFTILHLYLHGYVVYIAGRTESKVLTAIDEIKQEAEKRTTAAGDEALKRPLGELSYLHIDLLDLSSVDEAAKQFASKEKKLHVLINNAGLMGVPYELTKDKYEVQYQVNYVSHFLLSLKLLPQLQAVVDEGKVQPRVVTLASVGHNFAFKHFAPSDTINKNPNVIYTWVRYGQAKTANIQFASEFAKKYPDILSVSVHPGIILGTELYNYWKKLPVIGWIFKGSSWFLDKSIGVSNEEGATASLKLAMDPSVTAAEDNGKYYSTGGVEDTASKIARDPEFAKLTWDWNLEQLNERGFHLKG